MSATFAKSAAPSNSIRVWCDAKYIYAELPTAIGSPACVMSFTRDGAGLSKVLNLIYGHADNSSSMPENFRAAKKLVGTPAQHGLAEAILRRRGILK